MPIEKIDSITFIDGNDLPTDNASITGSWLWRDEEVGYYELLAFNDDKTYTAYDNYFAHDFYSMTYGWYLQVGSMLTLQSNIYEDITYSSCVFDAKVFVYGIRRLVLSGVETARAGASGEN